MADTSKWSLWSRNSVLSIASENSALSIGSVGSVLSIGSVGSALSAGSIASAASSQSLLSFASHRSVMAARRSGCLADRPLQSAPAAVVGACLALVAAGVATSALRRGSAR